MSERLEFGKPRDIAQALLRLPSRQHPDYVKTGGPIEHLTYFKEHLEETISLIKKGIEITPKMTWIPLELDDMKLLEKVSFYRSSKPIITADWVTIQRENSWALLLPRDDDEEYRWWQITQMRPSLGLPDEMKLICVETNTRFMGERVNYRYNELSVFDFFVVKPEELQNLCEELARFG